MNGKSNGHVNHAFREEEQEEPRVEEPKGIIEESLKSSPQTKTKYPAPPPPVAYESQMSSIDLDLALAALDDVLFVEECKTRKVSVGSVSNGSKGFNEHDVVALVHREDVKSINHTPVVEDLPPLPEAAQTVVESVSEEPKIENLEKVTKEPDTIIAPSVPINPIENETSKPLVDNLEVISVNSEPRGEEALLSPPPPPLPVFTSFDIPTIPRISTVTASDLKSVTLKSRRPESPPVDYDVPPNDHLVFGTLEHKDFKSRLEVLLRNPSMTSEPMSPVTPKSPRPKTVGPSGIAANEFVVQDRIRTSDARKTLSAFFLSDKAIFPNGVRPIPNAPKVEIEVKIQPVENDVSKLTNGELLKLEHSQRMAGTLRSIRLRKVDSFKNDDTQ